MQRYLALQKIVELGSFSKAAKALFHTQSAVSQMIASLETELGFALLVRSRRGVRLTAEGKALYPAVERAVADYRAVRERANEIRGLEGGTVRIGTVSSITCHWLPEIIRDFEKKYPNVRFILHQGDYTSIQEWIKTDAVDFGFVNPAAVKGLQTQTLKKGEMVAVLPAKHPLAALKRVPLKKLAKEPFILLEEGHYSEPLAAFAAEGIKPLVKYTVHDDYAIMTMAEAGLGVSVLAELVLRRTRYKLAVRPLFPAVTRTLAVGYKDKKSLPLASRYFIDFLLKQKNKLP